MGTTLLFIEYKLHGTYLYLFGQPIDSILQCLKLMFDVYFMPHNMKTILKYNEL